MKARTSPQRETQKSVFHMVGFHIGITCSNRGRKLRVDGRRDAWHGNATGAHARLSITNRADCLSVENLMASRTIINAMTVDAEDYFHVSAFAQQIESSTWGE